MLQHKELRKQLQAVGYFPAILGDVIDLALAGQAPVAFYVHPDVAFGPGTIGRHLSVLALTPSRLIVIHADDHSEDEYGPAAVAVSTEAVRLKEIKSVAVSQIFDQPDSYQGGVPPRVIQLAVSWGGAHTVETEPAGCADPDCELDHGYSGAIASEDVSVAVTASLLGDEAAVRLSEFARRLSAAAAL
ncbi:MAG: DUF5998 family protein [Bifidobacteriaceae bacterium]|jgi:hypothetical protein|nr:DUF5998 family protein [Bifidobacteriaceae bacterium]